MRTHPLGGKIARPFGRRGKFHHMVNIICIIEDRNAKNNNKGSAILVIKLQFPLGSKLLKGPVSL